MTAARFSSPRTTSSMHRVAVPNRQVTGRGHYRTPQRSRR
jgi:hypothetical protein